jgi:hypothetical protein
VVLAPLPGVTVEPVPRPLPLLVPLPGVVPLLREPWRDDRFEPAIPVPLPLPLPVVPVPVPAR